MLRPFSRARAWLAAGAAVAAMAPVLLVAAPAQADASDYTGWEMLGESGDYIAGPLFYGYAAPSSVLTVEGTTGGLTVHVQEGPVADRWEGHFAAPDGQQLTAGTTYTLAERFSSPDHPGLDVSGEGRECNTLTGTFTVHELETDPGTGSVTRFSATWEQHCTNGTSISPGASGTILVHASDPLPLLSTLSLTDTLSATPGTTVIFNGRLYGLLGSDPNALVTVTRTIGADTTAFGTFVTDTDGAFSFSDTVASAKATYTASFAGDARYQARTNTTTLLMRKLTPSLSVTVPKTDSRGHQVVIAGSLTSNAGAIGDATINVTRKDIAHTTTRVVQTSPDGTFSFTDSPAVGGQVSFRFSWAGDETHDAVTRTATMSVARRSTSLSVRATTTHLVWDKSTRLTVHLGKTYNGHHVQVYARRLGTSDTSPGHLVRSGNVNSHGDFAFSRTVTGRTVFTVKFAGDWRYAPAARSMTIHVAARIDLRVALYKDRAGAYYRYKNVDPLAEIHVRPGLPNGCMKATAQRLVSGKWETVATLSCAPVDAGSYGYLRFASARVPGAHYRMRVTGGATATVSNGSTPWLYFEFI